MNSRARLECLRSRVSLLALAGRFTSMRHYGRAEHVGLCPLHSESHPSFFVNTEAGRFHCFGCEAGGDVFRFLEILLACDFRESVRQAARLASGKPLSLPAVGLVFLPYRCAGGAGGPEAPRIRPRPRAGKADPAYFSRWSTDLHVATLALPLSMRVDLGAESLLLEKAK